MVVYIDKSQFDNFISIHTKQLVLGLTAFFSYQNSSRYPYGYEIVNRKCQVVG